MKKECNELAILENQLFQKSTKNSFKFFWKEIFSKSLETVWGKYIHGSYYDEWCDLYQNNDRVCLESARGHSKSVVCHGFVVFSLGSNKKKLSENLYFSFKQEMAEHHLKHVNRYIETNDYFKDYKRLTTAESIVHYMSPDGCEFKVQPSGIKSFKRGMHPNGFIILDDPLKDPEVKLDISQIQKITNIVNDEIEPMPVDGCKLFIVGTRQDEHDLFAVKKKDERYVCKTYPAIISETQEKVLWPEEYPFEKLLQIRNSIGEASFNREYQCHPVRGTFGYIQSKELSEVINPELKPIDYEIKNPTTTLERRAGFDVGKKRHPSHFTVYEWDGGTNHPIKQILSLWFDRQDYTYQIDVIQNIIENIGIDYVYYDATRGEFEAMQERGDLPDEFQPIMFNVKTKNSMANAFGKSIRLKKIMLLDEERQTRQILNCDADLKSVETGEGHGDSFWSNAMVIESFNEPELGVVYI